MTYVDGYSKKNKKYIIMNILQLLKLYMEKALNDHLTKIITQKFIAQTPYLVLEMWSDFRRLGLPFFEIPANESSMTGSENMLMLGILILGKTDRSGNFIHNVCDILPVWRMQIEGYKQAVGLLGGSEYHHSFYGGPDVNVLT